MSERNFELSGVGVHIGMPAYRDIPPQTALALVETALALTMEQVPFNLNFDFNCCYVDQVRCLIADEFLKTSATHLFMIDSDMVWRGADFLRILAHATLNECVAATYRLKTEDERYAVNIPPMVKVNEYGCIPANGLGLGFCCVQRKVIEELTAKAPKLKITIGPGKERVVPAVFQCDHKDGYYRGEDIKFFADVMELGYTPWLDLNVDLDHLGRVGFRGKFRDALEALQRQASPTYTDAAITRVP